MNNDLIDASKNGKEEKKKVVIYGRIRHYLHFDRRSLLLDQIRPLRQYASKNGLRVARVFTDSAPANQLDRKGLVKMIRFLRENPSIKTIIVCSFDRLCRTIEGYLMVRDLINNLGVNIVTPKATDTFCSNVTLYLLTTIIQSLQGEGNVKSALEKI